MEATLEKPTFSAEINDIVVPKEKIENILFTVGSVLRGDDAAGPLLARSFRENPIEGWTLLEGDQTPEDDLGYIERIHPTRLVLVDAADMGLEPGATRRLTITDVKTKYLFTTHSMPITYLLGRLGEACDQLDFIGIQPAQTEFYSAVTPAVREAVDALYNCLVSGADLTSYLSLS